MTTHEELMAQAAAEAADTIATLTAQRDRLLKTAIECVSALYPVVSGGSVSSIFIGARAAREALQEAIREIEAAKETHA